MKTVQQLQQDIYEQALSSGYFKNMQAQLKSYVFDLIEKQYGSRAKGFQYQHPLLAKMRQYPLTSLCMDLVQEFLESFKFKHTLNVFKKEVNRTYNISRKSLSEQFRIQIKNPESQAVLISMVTQMVSGDIGAVRQPLKNNFVQNKAPEPPSRSNYMMGDPKKSMGATQATNKSNISAPPQPQKPSNQNNSFSNASYSEPSGPSEPINSSISPSTSKIDNSASQPIPSPEVSAPSNIESSEQSSEIKPPEKEEKKGKEGKKKKKEEKQKPPEGATDLLGDVMKKFEGIAKVNKQQQKKSLFDSKRAFSQQKQKKVVDVAESGANKIRGISAGKSMSSLMSKFMPQAAQPAKNDSYIDEQLDQFQMSKDSTRRNPLFSSSQSGFQKSGFDYSVDSNSIDQYEYSERARKVFKKM